MPGLSTVGQSPERWPPPCLSSPRLEQAWGWRGAGPQPLADPRTPGTAPAPSPVTAGMAHADAAGAASGALPLSPRLSACSCTQRCFGSTPPFPGPGEGRVLGAREAEDHPLGTGDAQQHPRTGTALPPCPGRSRFAQMWNEHLRDTWATPTRRPWAPGGGCPAQALCPAVAGGGSVAMGLSARRAVGAAAGPPPHWGQPWGLRGLATARPLFPPPSRPPICVLEKKKRQ